MQEMTELEKLANELIERWSSGDTDIKYERWIAVAKYVQRMVVLPPKDVLCDMLGELRAKGYSWEEIAQAVIDDIYRLNPQINRKEP